MPMDYIARALEVDESRGFMKAVVDADTGQILGAAVLGLEGGEIMAMLQIAMMGKVEESETNAARLQTPKEAIELNYQRLKEALAQELLSTLYEVRTAKPEC